MKIIQRFFWGHLLLASAAVAAAYGLAGSWAVAPVVAALGGLWFFAQRRGVPGFGGLLLFIYLGALAACFWVGGPDWMLLLGAVLSVGTWDLDNFLQRLKTVERVEYESGLGRNHLRRLMVVEAVGFLTALPALVLRIELQFWWVALLILLVVFGISRIIAFVRKATG